MKRTRVSQNGQVFCGRRMGLLLVLVFVGLAATIRRGQLLFAHWRRTDLVLVEREQVTKHPVVDLDRSLVLGKHLGLDAKACDDVIAALAALDGKCELAAAPVIHLDVLGATEEGVEPTEPIVDGVVFELRVEDIHRLILTRHAWAILPLVVTAPRWLPKREEGDWPVRDNLRPAEPEM